MNDITLRIIKDQNPKQGMCCLSICCIETVTHLNLEERLIILSCGYIRIYTDD